jgi:hypothetical protein
LREGKLTQLLVSPREPSVKRGKNLFHYENGKASTED